MTQRREFLTSAAAASAVLALRPGLAHATQGVSKNEIVVGTIQDLSGPIVALGKNVQNGMILRTEQINSGGASTAARSSWSSRIPATTRRRVCSPRRSCCPTTRRLR